MKIQSRNSRKARPKGELRTSVPIAADLTDLPLGNPTDEENLEFLRAVDAYKRRTGKNFPSWTEILRIVQGMGYRKA